MEKVKLLIVEDEGVLARGLQNRLTKLGYSPVGTAATGEDAIRLAGANNPDLVLMDIRLKGEMDGIEAAREIRSRFDIPVIYLTAYGDKETMQRARITEPYGYIGKPVQERELQCNIEIALYKHKMEGELLNKKKLEAFGLFADGIAHDFNNLLNIVNGNIELAIERCDRREKDCVVSLDKAREYLFKASDLANKFLNIFKGEPLTTKAMKLPTAIEKIIEKEKYLRNGKIDSPATTSTTSPSNISYNFDFTHNRLSISGDEDLLAEMFANILANSVEAMADRETGRIGIKVEDITISRDSTHDLPLKEGQYVKVSIHDNGKGIPGEQIDKVFDPYFSTKDEPSKKGLGLGLTLCYSIIKRHRGHIVIHSETGQGTIVDVYLPALAK